MKRRILRFGLILACAGSTLTGCEWLDHNLRSRAKDDDLIAAGSESESKSKSEGVIGAGPEAQGDFFKSSRLSGAMSSEGREIEKSLGVH